MYLAAPYTSINVRKITVAPYAEGENILIYGY